MKGIQTLIARTDIYGNRINLAINHDTKEMHFAGSMCFEVGEVTYGMGIRQVNAKHKELKASGYKNVSHAHVRDGWKS